MYLVCWAGKVFRKSTSSNIAIVGVKSDDLGAEVASSADCSDVGTRSRERWQKFVSLLAIVGHASFILAHTIVSGGEKQCDTSSAELSKFSADTDRVVLWHSLLVITVRSRDDVGNFLLLHNIVEPDEIGLVGIRWREKIRLEWWRASGAVGGESGWVSNASDRLDIEIGFDTWHGLIVGGICDQLRGILVR